MRTISSTGGAVPALPVLPASKAANKRRTARKAAETATARKRDAGSSKPEPLRQIHDHRCRRSPDRMAAIFDGVEFAHHAAPLDGADGVMFGLDNIGQRRLEGF